MNLRFGEWASDSGSRLALRLYVGAHFQIEVDCLIWVLRYRLA